MFQTTLPTFASVHAAGRCISGGPIYITDTPGSHSMPIIHQMAATSIRDNSRAIVLRPSTVSLPVDPYVPYNGRRFLKLATEFGSSSLLAVFNVSQVETSGLITLSEFQGLERDANNKYVVRQQSTGKIFGPTTSALDSTLISLTLPVAGWEFLSAFPVHRGDGFDVGALGLVSQLAGAAAVLACLVEKDGTLTKVTVRVKALGILGLYSIPRYLGDWTFY